MVLLAVDPGTTRSAVIAVDIQSRRILDVGIIPNEEALDSIRQGYYDFLTLEGITSYGQPIGQETLDTVFLNGRLYQIGIDREIKPTIIPRKDIKSHFDVPRKVNADAFIRRTLIDKYAEHDKKNGKGTKSKPDWFFGVTADIWAACALAYCWIDKLEAGELKC